MLKGHWSETDSESQMRKQAGKDRNRDQVSCRQAAGWRDGEREKRERLKKKKCTGYLQSEQQADRLINRETDNLRERHTELGSKKVGRQCPNRQGQTRRDGQARRLTEKQSGKQTEQQQQQQQKPVRQKNRHTDTEKGKHAGREPN